MRCQHGFLACLCTLPSCPHWDGGEAPELCDVCRSVECSPQCARMRAGNIELGLHCPDCGARFGTQVSLDTHQAYYRNRGRRCEKQPSSMAWRVA